MAPSVGWLLLARKYSGNAKASHEVTQCILTASWDCVEKVQILQVLL
jgi:hypothetical protein